MKKNLGYLVIVISVIIFIAVFGAFITIVKEILKIFATRFEIQQISYTITLIIGVLAFFFFAKFLWKFGIKLINNRITKQ
jgi:hypothetical protein